MFNVIKMGVYCELIVAEGIGFNEFRLRYMLILDKAVTVLVKDFRINIPDHADTELCVYLIYMANKL